MLTLDHKIECTPKHSEVSVPNRKKYIAADVEMLSSGHERSNDLHK